MSVGECDCVRVWVCECVSESESESRSHIPEHSRHVNFVNHDVNE